MSIRKLIFRIVGLALCATPGWQYCIGQTTSQTTSSYWTVEVRDLSPRFLDFYRNAVADQASPDRRWELWKEKYDFAAVPPIAAGQAIARRQLDEAWPQYLSSLARIEAGAVALRPSPQSRLDEVVALLRPQVSGQIQLTAFVGTFHRSAFASGKKEGVWQIAIPLEDSDQDHALDMTHEFTHAVQRAAGHWDANGGRGHLLGGTGHEGH